MRAFNLALTLPSVIVILFLNRPFYRCLYLVFWPLNRSEARDDQYLSVFHMQMFMKAESFVTKQGLRHPRLRGLDQTRVLNTQLVAITRVLTHQ